MISFPSTACVGKIMPKDAFYNKLNLSAELKSKFVSDVQRITMAYDLTADSIRVDKSEKVVEILVLSIQLKKKEFDNRIIETIARKNPHKLVFVLKYENEIQLALYFGKLYKTEWLLADAAELTLQGRNMEDIWNGFVEQIALKDEITSEQEQSVEERLKRQDKIAKLQGEIEKLERMIQKEMQPKKKFELHQIAINKKMLLDRLMKGN